MKRVKFILNLLVIFMVFVVSSCDDEIDRSSTHTENVSEMVIGTYSGTISLDTTASFNDVTIVLTKNENDSVDAVSVNIKSSNFDYNGAVGLDLPVYYNTTTKEFYADSLYLNVAKANDTYSFACVNSSALKFNGRLNGNELFMNVPILVVSGRTIFHANGVSWYFNGTKK
ncbi:MAG: hypothetical protein M0P66_16960 [Salinivirgaceae bacterium]|nr:hypothetical protein [Salinivirgaceae bacterium]